jgi:hypothetical protein
VTPRDLVLEFYVGGVGLWTPGYAGMAAWLAGVPDPAVAAVRPEILPPTLRRRATPFTSMIAAAAAEAAQGGADLARVPMILGAALGEDGMLAMLEELRTGEGLPSPTRFHNSVQNAPVAYLSIAAGNRGFSTTLAAGWETPAAALLEAGALLAERGGDALVLLGDEPPSRPFDLAESFPRLAVALHLSAEPGPATRATLRGPRRAAGGRPDVPPAFANHTCAGGLALAVAVARGVADQAVTVRLGPAGHRGWDIEVAPRRTTP